MEKKKKKKISSMQTVFDELESIAAEPDEEVGQYRRLRGFRGRAPGRQLRMVHC